MRWVPSARLIVALLMVIPVVAIASILIFLSCVTASKIAEDLGTQIVERASSAVQENIRDFLESASRLSNLYALRIQQTTLSTTRLTSWEPYMIDDLRTSPDVASICFGNAEGDCTWLLRNGTALELGRVDGSHPNSAQEFIVDPGSGIPDLEHPKRTYFYDPHVRPWYQTALASEAPIWTPIYFWFGQTGADAVTGAGFTRKVEDPQTQEFRGVLVIDVTLAALSDFLRGLPLSQTGSIFIADDQGLLVAASRGSVNSSGGTRVALSQSENLSAAAAADLMKRLPDKRDQSATVMIHDEPVRLSTTHFEPQNGLHWVIITALPERAFLAEAEKVRHRSILVGIAAIALALGLAVAMARFVCKPIIAVRNHARRIGVGEFESRLSLTKVRELRDLSNDLNQMAIDLKDRMEIRHALMLANEVQQSLLPQAPPRIAGIDMVGYSKYCDEAGGDYFDFIDLAELPLKQTLIAVGDVMGHGIASALLMATARAALRATAIKEGSLGVLLTRVNDVLAADARHGRFMTMALGVLNPSTGAMRWASAGHDPPIIYSPVRGGIRDISGGDIPLGITPGIFYEECMIENIEPGSVIVFGTDGIWEATAPTGEQFGKQRLYEVIRKHAYQTAAEIAQQIRIAMAEFAQVEHYRDDVTYVVVKLWLST